MRVRTKHGNATNFAGPSKVLETAMGDHSPEPMPADARQESPTDRGAGGRFAPGNSLATAGGKAKSGKTKLATKLGLRGKLPDDSAQRPYRASAETFRRVTSSSIAATFGAGVCGPIPSSMTASGSLALCWSRYYLDLAALAAESDPVKAAAFVELGMKLAEQSAKFVRWAQEIASNEAQARPRAPVDPLAAFRLPPPAKDGAT